MSVRSGIATVERVRELGATEFLMDAMEQRGGIHLVRMIDFDGPVDVEVLETAFGQLVARRPLLHVRIDRAGQGRPVFVRDDSVSPPFSVVERRDPSDWVREFDEELNTPISLDGDAPVRVRVLASDDPGGEIIVTAAHSVCDGRSLFVFCRDLLDEYEALMAGGGTSCAPVGTIPPPLEALLPEWLSGERLEAMIEDFLVCATETAAEPIVLFPLRPHDAGPAPASHVLTYSIPPAETAALRHAARGHGTSVTGAVAAAEAQALAELSRPTSDQWVVPAVTIDIRPHLREPVPLADLGAYPGNAFGRHKEVGSMDTWVLARDVTTQVTAKLERGHHLVMAVLGERFADQFVTVDRPIGSYSLANLGSQDLPVEGSVLRPRCIRGGAPLNVSRFPGVYSQAVTTAGTLWLTLVHVEPMLTGEVARAYGESVVDRLLSLARRSD
ncbi:MAG: condensation domain-containing protein [Acidimicrobiia bacterium]